MDQQDTSRVTHTQNIVRQKHIEKWRNVLMNLLNNTLSHISMVSSTCLGTKHLYIRKFIGECDHFCMITSNILIGWGPMLEERKNE